MEWKGLERHLEWPGEITKREQKEALGQRVAERVEDGQVLGVGSGSTAFLALLAIGERVREEGLSVTAVPTSRELGLACAALGLPVASLAVARPDWGFDGADEVDGDGNLLKGRGGAMLREKMVMAAATSRTLILIDESKKVERLGKRFPVPVEVHPEALSLVRDRLEPLGPDRVELRPAGDGKDGPVLTEAGNLILDVGFDNGLPGDPIALERRLKTLPGVVETGLFAGFPVEVMTP